MTDDDRTAAIIQWNDEGILTSKQDIIKLIELYYPLVLCFQETYLANDCHIKLNSYNAISKQGTFNRR